MLLRDNAAVKRIECLNKSDELQRMTIEFVVALGAVVYRWPK